MEGIVLTYFANRKYGFIKTVDGNRFFHISNYRGTPRLGEHVTFDLAEPTTLGQPQQAVNVVPLQESAGGGVQ